jgi:hypothetical protein
VENTVLSGCEFRVGDTCDIHGGVDRVVGGEGFAVTDRVFWDVGSDSRHPSVKDLDLLIY